MIEAVLNTNLSPKDFRHAHRGCAVYTKRSEPGKQVPLANPLDFSGFVPELTYLNVSMVVLRCKEHKVESLLGIDA